MLSQPFSEPELPHDLLVEHLGDPERRNSAYIKLATKMTSSRDTYISYCDAFCYYLKQEASVNKNAVLSFLKVCASLQYLNYDNIEMEKICDLLFEQLEINCGNLSDYKAEYDLVGLMLLEKRVYNRKIRDIFQKALIQIKDIPNMYLSLLCDTVKNVNAVLSGDLKGTLPDQDLRGNLISYCFRIVEEREAHIGTQYSDIVDEQKTIELLTNLLKLMLKFQANRLNYQNGQIIALNEVWKKRIMGYETFGSNKLADNVFGLMEEMVNFGEIFMSHLKNDEVFNFAIHHSLKYALCCSNVNKFWNTFLNRKLLSPHIKDFDTVRFAKFCTFCLEIPSEDQFSTSQKLVIVDNILLSSKIGVRSNQLMQIIQLTSLQKNLNPENVEVSEKVKQLMIMSYSALYSPLFKMQDSAKKTTLNYYINLMNMVSSIASPNRSQILQLLNILPAIKIIMLKLQDMLAQDRNLQYLMVFLFVYVWWETEGKYFYKFISMTCQQVKKLLSKCIDENLRNLVRIVHMTIMRCMNSVNLKIQKQYNQSQASISCPLKCLKQLIECICPFEDDLFHHYIEIAISMLQKRNRVNDLDMKIFMKFLLKQRKVYTPQKTLNLISMLFNIIVREQRHFYIDLIFDFAQAHAYLHELHNFMSENDQKIHTLCLEYSHGAQFFRCLKYKVMVQSQRKDLFQSNSIANFLLNSLFDCRISKLHFIIKSLQVIRKQRMVFQECSNSQYFKQDESLLNFIHLLVVILNNINESLQQDDKYTKSQKIRVCKAITFQLYCYTCMINPRSIAHCEETMLSICRNIRDTITCSKLINFQEFLQSLKNMFLAKLMVETGHATTLLNRNYNEQNQKQLKMLNSLFNKLKIVKKKKDEPEQEIDRVLKMVYGFKYICLLPQNNLNENSKVKGNLNINYRSRSDQRNYRIKAANLQQINMNASATININRNFFAQARNRMF